MRINLRLSHQGLILVLVPLAFELVFLFVLNFQLQQAELEVQEQIRSKAILYQADTLAKLFYDAGVAMGGYSITKSPLFSDRFNKIIEQIPAQLNQLEKTVGANDKQQHVLKNLRELSGRGLKILSEAKSTLDDSSGDLVNSSTRHMYREVRMLADQLQEQLRLLTEEARKFESESYDEQNRSRRQLKILIVLGVIVNILLVLVVAVAFMRGISRRLNVLTDNSYRLARGDTLNPPLAGGDEIAHLDGVFHSMADALTEASRKERAVVENAVDVICSIDAEGKFTAVSPASKQVWGYEPEDLIGRRFIEIVVPEDVQETIKSARAVRSERGTMSFENRTKRQDGTLVTVLWSAYWSDKERSMFCVAHDITERKLAEEAIKASEARIRMIIDNMLVGLIIMSKDGIVEGLNPRCETLFGYQPSEVVGRHFLCLFKESKFYSEVNREDTKSFMGELFAKALNRIGAFDCLRKNGEDFPVELSLNEFNYAGGSRYMVNLLDVSERREVEKLKKEFVATVSHELRTPLTSIRGSLTLLNVGALGLLPDAAKKAVTIAERNTIRLIALINDILDIEKLESGKLDMVFDSVLISNVFERSFQSVNAFADSNGVILEMVPTFAQCYADGDRLVQVVVNLMSNAIKFSPKGGKVTVVCEESPQSLIVKVIDHGRGIPEKYKSLLFQRFQQVETSDARKKGGTGLGLAICKGIIEQHAGQIGVDSEEGKGSTFWFSIPPARPESKALPVAQVSEKS